MIKLDPKKENGRYVFVTSKESLPNNLTPLMSFQEREGATYIINIDDAKQLGVSINKTWSWISLGYESDLEMTGLTASISKALSDAGIPCNIVAAFYHDHIFVPDGRSREAVQILDTIRI